MKTLKFFFIPLMLLTFFIHAQDQRLSQPPTGHLNVNKFKQLKEELPTPNKFRTASGAPGEDYYQQRVDYVMNIELDDKNKRLYGEEEITYTNNSPDMLEYLRGKTKILEKKTHQYYKKTLKAELLII